MGRVKSYNRLQADERGDRRRQHNHSKVGRGYITIEDVEYERYSPSSTSTGRRKRRRDSKSPEK